MLQELLLPLSVSGCQIHQHGLQAVSLCVIEALFHSKYSSIYLGPLSETEVNFSPTALRTFRSFSFSSSRILLFPIFPFTVTFCIFRPRTQIIKIAHTISQTRHDQNPIFLIWVFRQTLQVGWGGRRCERWRGGDSARYGKKS